MPVRIPSLAFLVLLVLGMFTFSLRIQPVKAIGTIYIMTDGSFYPWTAPIQYTLGWNYCRLYTLTGNIATYTDGIVIEPDSQGHSIFLDGDGYSIEGAGKGTGISLSGVANVEIMNMEIRNFDVGVYLESSTNNKISAANITNSGCGISMYRSSGNSIFANMIADNQENPGVGIMLKNSSGNRIYYNDFIGNKVQVYDSSQTSQSIPASINNWDKNFWSDHNGTDKDADGTGDTPHLIDISNVDHYPLMSDKPLSPGYYDTSAFLIGKVAVGIVFPESNGTIDPNTENWTQEQESRIVADIGKALKIWEDWNPTQLSFVTEVHYSVPTSYEPMSHTHLEDAGLWISQVVENMGYASTLDYVNDLRNRLKTDWSLVIFMVANFNNPDGAWNEPIGGPYIIHPYGSFYFGDTWYWSVAHAIGHTFYATDEYNDIIEHSGYLNVSDKNTRDCIMGCVNNAMGGYDRPCDSAAGQLGWTDTDADGIPDIIDTFPRMTMDLVSNQSGGNAVRFTGSITEAPLPNRNQYRSQWPSSWAVCFRVPHTGRSITIKTITSVEYRIDYGSWVNATASDGTFNEAEENFTFTIPLPADSHHVIEVRGTNSVGNSVNIVMKPYCGEHDVGVGSLNASKTIVGQGHSVNVTVQISNYDAEKESFNVTFYANSTTIQTQTVELTAQNLTAFTIVWNSTGVTCGNYTLTAYAEPVLGETDTSDNNCTCWVLVSGVSDINEDGRVDMKDVSYVARRFMCTPSDPLWDSIADVNSDGRIDMKDISTVARNFGEHYP